jgi:hypothetical protein
MSAVATHNLGFSSEGPLSTEHFQELSRADDRAKLIRKAARVASFNGWTTAIIAALSAPFALFSVDGFLVTVVLALVAWNEFRGRNLLNKFNPKAAILLGWNQLGFLAMIILYCSWMMYTGINESDTALSEFTSNPELGDLLGSPEQVTGLYELLVYGVYGSVIVLSVIFQGLTSLYYFTRRKHIEAYVRATPEWVRKLQAK